jgi:hypothetical protein
MEMKGHRHATEESTKISQHLKIVKIKCETVNETVLNVLNFMGTLNICKITTNTGFAFYISIWFIVARGSNTILAFYIYGAK